MTRVGVTGHQEMPAVAVKFARTRIRELLTEQARPLVGLSSLAVGADQIFAIELLALGGELNAVVPADDYESTFSASDRLKYTALIAEASSATVLDFAASSETAYNAAGAWIVENCDLLIAVWDGLQARGLGGTGDVVASAKALGRQVVVVWPAGVRRK